MACYNFEYARRGHTYRVTGYPFNKVRNSVGQDYVLIDVGSKYGKQVVRTYLKDKYARNSGGHPVVVTFNSATTDPSIVKDYYGITDEIIVAEFPPRERRVRAERVKKEAGAKHVFVNAVTNERTVVDLSTYDKVFYAVENTRLKELSSFGSTFASLNIMVLRCIQKDVAHLPKKAKPFTMDALRTYVTSKYKDDLIKYYKWEADSYENSHPWKLAVKEALGFSTKVPKEKDVAFASTFVNMSNDERNATKETDLSKFLSAHPFLKLSINNASSWQTLSNEAKDDLVAYVKTLI
jgi:hypothetical protein